VSSAIIWYDIAHGPSVAVALAALLESDDRSIGRELVDLVREISAEREHAAGQEDDRWALSVDFEVDLGSVNFAKARGDRRSLRVYGGGKGACGDQCCCDPCHPPPHAGSPGLL
jgi:hypothetical protein